MHNILFDPVLLVIPAETAPRDEIEAWFEALEIWALALNNTSYHWFHLRDLIEKHLGYERLPSFKLLRMLQKRYQLDITLPAITALVNEIFLQDAWLFLSALEAHIIQYGLIVEPIQDTIVVQPYNLIKRWPPELSDALTNLLAETGVGKSKGEPFSNTVVLATVNDSSITRQLAVSGNALILSMQDEQGPFAFSATFPIILKLEDLVPTDIRAAWEMGEYGMTVTIERQFKQHWQTIVSQPLPFALGPQFLASICERGAHTNRVVLSRIVFIAAAVIANKAMTISCDLHPLGETASSNSLQQTRARDGAKAWRLHLTEKGSGWRMHYWHIPGPHGGGIEFSNIRKKHEPEIIF